MSKLSTAWGPMSIRVIIGIGFIYHGFIKLFTSWGHDIFLRMLTEIGIPGATVISWLIGAIEFFGGIAILLGAFVTIASIILILNMLVAMFTVNISQGFNVFNVTVMVEAGPKYGLPGYEINLLYIAGLITLLIAGAGMLSIDKYLKERSKPESSE
ncbi:MAG TPA: DoxX family protein [Ignavibacteria bacterium]|nr:DoxX family protein [Ignavibacteria bacterium]